MNDLPNGYDNWSPQERLNYLFRSRLGLTKDQSAHAAAGRVDDLSAQNIAARAELDALKPTTTSEKSLPVREWL